MRLFFQFFALSDRYERKARLLPGLLLAAGPALTAGALLHELSEWYAAVGAGLGVEFLGTIVLGHYASARGRAIEESLWASWGGSPTTRWLRPNDATCSEQQKSKWRGAIKRLTGMTIPASVPEDGSDGSVDQAIGEATRQLRYVLRDNPHAGILQSHNEEYGFARNLCGVRFLWVALAVLCVAGCGVAYATGMKPHIAVAIAITDSVIAILVASELPKYVRSCADRYAESLLAAAILCASPSVSDGNRSNAASVVRP